MAKQSTADQSLITEVPLTAEAREQLIIQLFADELPHTGEVFVPDDTFYVSGVTSHQVARHMVRQLCQWLGIKPGYIGLEFESGGGDRVDGSRYTIYLESAVLRDEFVLGGFLALVLTRYLLEERKQIRLPAHDQQASLLASASIVFGLGLVVSNGLRPSYKLVNRFQRSRTSLLKGFPLANYEHMTLNFLRKYQVDHISYSHSLTPWAAKRMGVHAGKRLSHAVKAAQHKNRVASWKLAGVIWIGVVAFGIGGFVVLQHTKPLPAEAAAAKQTMALYQQLARACNDRVAYDQQYSDSGDIQAIRALNAEKQRCQSLQNQYEAAKQKYQSISSD